MIDRRSQGSIRSGSRSEQRDQPVRPHIRREAGLPRPSDQPQQLPRQFWCLLPDLGVELAKQHPDGMDLRRLGLKSAPCAAELLEPSLQHASIHSTARLDPPSQPFPGSVCSTVPEVNGDIRIVSL